MRDFAAMTVRLTPESHRLWMECTEAAGFSGGGAARVVLELFSERLRTNEGDMLEAMLAYRNALKNVSSGRFNAE